MPSSATAESYGRYQIVFQAAVKFYIPTIDIWMIQVTLYSCQHLVLSQLLILAILVGV